MGSRQTAARPIPATAATHWLYGAARDLIDDPLNYVLEMQKQHGDLFQISVPSVRIYSVTKPEYLDHILATRQGNYIKDRPTRSLKLALGDGLVPSDGETWRRPRQLIQPAFHRERLVGFARTMVGLTAEMLDRWRSLQGPFDILTEMTKLTADIVAKTLFGVRIDGMGSYSQDFHTVNAFLTQRFRSLAPLPMWMPLPANQRFKRALRRIEVLIGGIVATRRSIAEPPQDLLQMLMDARDAGTGEGLSDRQLRDQCFTLFGAGHETSATGLTWTLYLLSQHPGCLARLQAEVEEVLGSRPPRYEDLAKLKYTLQVIQESMRLYPPAWAIGREALVDDEIDGHVIPRGSQLLISAYALHRHPGLWDNPEDFDPGRFTTEAAAARHRFAYLPFGGGTRICVGRAFALMELQIVLAMIVQRCRLALVPGHPVVLDPLISLKPKHGIMMTLA